jgi:putative ABC transport system ATP-binding protein
MEIIRTEELDKIYQDNGVPVHALSNITVSIQRGEFLAIAGPSGSGKTTLLNLIGALDKPTGGKIFLEERDVASYDRSGLSTLRLNTMGFIFQAYNLIPVLTALENVEFKLMLLGIPERERKQKSHRMLEELGIGDLANKRPNEMSGGQQQRVAIARAIVNTPPLVLADEPTANLDTATAHALIDLMEKMNHEKNITFIFSSHDTQVLQHAHRVVWLRDGVITQDERKP